MSSSQMHYRPLGKCGTKVSVFGLGGWTTFGGTVKEEKTIEQVLHHAYEAGINFFDIADVYANGESERSMGRALKQFPRHTLVISSKVFFPISDEVNDRGLSRKHIFESIDKSLKNIGTDYLDIYFCHRFDPETPLEETARAMDDLIHRGKILYWGTSEWTGDQLKEAHALCEKYNLTKPQAEQPQYSLLERKKVETDVGPAAEKLGMGLVVWSPLGSGLLTGKYDQGVPQGSRLDRIEWLREAVLSQHRINKVKQMKKIADELGVTRAQLALAWLVAQSRLSSIITGATHVEQLQENLGALRVSLNAVVLKSLDSIFSVS